MINHVYEAFCHFRFPFSRKPTCCVNMCNKSYFWDPPATWFKRVMIFNICASCSQWSLDGQGPLAPRLLAVEKGRARAFAKHIEYLMTVGTMNPRASWDPQSEAHLGEPWWTCLNCLHICMPSKTALRLPVKSRPVQFGAELPENASSRQGNTRDKFVELVKS